MTTRPSAHLAEWSRHSTPTICPSVVGSLTWTVTMYPPEVLGGIDVPGHPICAGIYADHLALVSQGFTLRSRETTLMGFEPIRPTEGILLKSSTLTTTPSGHLAQWSRQSTLTICPSVVGSLTWTLQRCIASRGLRRQRCAGSPYQAPRVYRCAWNLR